MTTQTIPHDQDAENAVIGDMLALHDAVAPITGRLTPADFYDPRCGQAFALIAEAHRSGHVHDAISLSAAMRATGIDPDPRWLTEIASTGSGAWRKHADTVIEMRARRDLLAAIGEAAQHVRQPGIDPFDIADSLRANIAALAAPGEEPTRDLWQLDEFIDAPHNAEAPWVVPGLLRTGWRVVVVGSEGSGKSVLWRQFAVLAAQGIHPLEFDPINPVRTLLVDLENPADAITRTCRALRSKFATDAYEPGRAWLWHRPAGINLMSRTSRAELEANVAACRPDLVCIGPLYKAYSRGQNETDEDAARVVQEVLDDLRTRYEFALLLEHHAPQEQGGHRNMRPYGSSLWLRWPELGLGMEREYPDSQSYDVVLKRWRGDRMDNRWPNRLVRGGSWPWAGAA